MQLESNLIVACAALRDLFEARTVACLIRTLDERLRIVAAVGRGSSRLVGVSMSMAEGLSGYVARTGRPLHVPALESDARALPHLWRSSIPPPQALLSAPMIGTTSRCVGVLNVFDPVDTMPRRDLDLELLTVAAAQVAQLVARAHVAEHPPTTRSGRGAAGDPSGHQDPAPPSRWYDG